LEANGHISFLDRAVDENTGTLLVQAEFDNKKQIVRPGQYAKVRIPTTKNNAIVIPQRCVIELQGQYSVFVVDKENTIKSKQITPGNVVGDLLIIEDGLNAGDKVVIDGIQKVRNGAKVNPSVIEFESQNNSN